MARAHVPAVRWQKSSRSTCNGCCVEVAASDPRGVAVRDSKNPEGAVLRFAPVGWTGFLNGVKAGEFDLPEAAS